MIVAQMAAAQLGAAGLILFAGWVALRRACQARLRHTDGMLLLLDAAPMIAAWSVLTCLTARPVLAAIIVAASAVGLARGNVAKRAASSEPLVFTDGVLGSIFFYPSLYAEFVTPPVLIAALLAVFAGFFAIGSLESAIVQPIWLGWIAAVCLVSALCLLSPSRFVRRVLARPGVSAVSGEPEVDTAAYGLIGSVVIHTAAAAAERPLRRQNRSPGRSDSLPASFDPGGPVVLLQLESFFDARRLGGFVPSDLLPNYDRCVAGSIAHGRMEAPAFGANTVRTEFAALTGLPASELGLDRFNPYAAYARVPIDSIAWRLRAAGFRTVCIHPFAGRFYGRRRVIPNLGFDQFLDIGAFAGYDRGPTYMSDVTVVREIERVLAESGPRTFIFAITMGNHSPWQRPTLGAMPDLPQGEAFARFLAGLAETDVAIGAMAELMRRKWRSGMFAAFGDHLPSFPGLFRHLDHVSRATDYVMWQADRAFGEHRDIMAHQLPGLLLRAAESEPSSRTVSVARLQP